MFGKEREVNKNMDFGDAIKALKSGKKLTRRGWNGKGQYIDLGVQVWYKDVADVMRTYSSLNKVIVFHGTTNVQVGWLASQADMLAEDWEVVE